MSEHSLFLKLDKINKKIQFNDFNYIKNLAPQKLINFHHDKYVNIVLYSIRFASIEMLKCIFARVKIQVGTDGLAELLNKKDKFGRSAI